MRFLPMLKCFVALKEIIFFVKLNIMVLHIHPAWSRETRKTLEITYKLLDLIVSDDPTTNIEHTKHYGLHDMMGFRQLF